MKLTDKEIKRMLSERGKSMQTPKEEKRYQEGLARTIKVSAEALYEAERERVLSRAEFLYQQSRYIQKRWWLLQGAVLLLLWWLIQTTGSPRYISRYLGVTASVFGILILPELWKNRGAQSVEVECAAYYSLPQIYGAKIFVFALVDALLLAVFFAASAYGGDYPLEELIIQFFMPYFVTCGLCFQSLYGKRFSGMGQAAILCGGWCVLWTEIVLNDVVYQAIALPLWWLMLGLSGGYLVYVICRGQRHYKEILEGNPSWN